MAPTSQKNAHRHTEVTKHVLRQQAGVPYEVERKLCSSCREVLDERPLRRTTA
jgi:NMD protein affecting ribosome stability and mRNA decay